MRLTIAGYGAMGHYIRDVFGRDHEITVYDPPKGFCDRSVLREADFVFVCVPTPARADGSCDISLVENVVASASPRLAIVCVSTVAIGTTERLIGTYGKPLVFVPEYAGEAPDHPYRSAANRDFFIYGGYEPALSHVRRLFESAFVSAAKHHEVSPTMAETVKYMENAFLALKVTFCNEIYDLCAALGIDYEQARRLWLEDARIGESHTAVTAERGYGGKCLPKDVLALCASAREVGVTLESLEAAQRSNTTRRAGHREEGIDDHDLGAGRT